MIAASGCSGPTVVVIDDERPVLTLLRTLLELDGYQVYDALSGSLGLHLIPAVEPAVVLVDVMMPDMDGVELCRRITSYYPSLPVVVLTASADPAVRERCMEAGAARFLSKPLLPGQLAGVLAGLRTPAVAAPPAGA